MYMHYLCMCVAIQKWPRVCRGFQTHISTEPCSFYFVSVAWRYMYFSLVSMTPAPEVLERGKITVHSAEIYMHGMVCAI